jgi:hypothetical protein
MSKKTDKGVETITTIPEEISLEKAVAAKNIKAINDLVPDISSITPRLLRDALEVPNPQVLNALFKNVRKEELLAKPELMKELIDINRAEDIKYILTDILKMEAYQYIPFLMFVNSNVMRIFKSPTFTEIGRFDTKQVLAFYDPESIEGIIYQSTLITLIQAWLHDLSYHWKSENPPYIEQMKEIGLFALFVDGTTEELDLL